MELAHAGTVAVLYLVPANGEAGQFRLAGDHNPIAHLHISLVNMSRHSGIASPGHCAVDAMQRDGEPVIGWPSSPSTRLVVSL